MRRAMLCLATLAAALAAPPTADAHSDACTGTGVMVAGAPLRLYPRAFTSTSFHLTLTTGSCALKTTVTFQGTLTGWCDEFYAYGVTGGGGHAHDFAITASAFSMVFSNEVVGTGAYVADPPAACATGATRFLVTVTVGKPTAGVPVPQPLEKWCADTAIDC